MNAVKIWLSCLIAAASRATVQTVDLKAAEPSEQVTTRRGEITAWDQASWSTMKDRKASDILPMADVDLGYSLEDAPWTEELTDDPAVNKILRNCDFPTKMRILAHLEAQGYE